MALELPGFQHPGSPNADDRLTIPLGQRVEMMILDNVPIETQTPNFLVSIEKFLGTQVETLATSNDNAQIVNMAGSLPGTKSYWLMMFPDEIVFLRGTYLVRVLVGKREVFRKCLTVAASARLK